MDLVGDSSLWSAMVRHGSRSEAKQRAPERNVNQHTHLEKTFNTFPKVQSFALWTVCCSCSGNGVERDSKNDEKNDDEKMMKKRRPQCNVSTHCRVSLYRCVPQSTIVIQLDVTVSAGP